MKYVMLFAGPSDDGQNPQSEADQAAMFDEIMTWWGTHAAAGTIIGGERLEAASSATTFTHAADGNIATIDGPFIESKEEVSGYGLIEVADLDAALALAKSWPLLKVPGQSVEVRPVLAM